MKTRKGERLVLIYALAFCVLVLALHPSFPEWRGITSGRSARKMQSASHLHNVGLGLLGYEMNAPGLPTRHQPVGQNQPLQSWMTRILPDLDQQNLYEQVHLDRPWDDLSQLPAFRQPIGIFRNPQEDPSLLESGRAPSHYAGNAAIFDRDQILRTADFPDGTFQTILAGEAQGNFRAWGDPGNTRSVGLGINKSPHGFGAQWNSGSGCRNITGANFLFADGSARFLSDTIDPRVLKALSTPDGREVVGPGFP